MPTPSPAPTPVQLVTAAQIMAVTVDEARTAIESAADQEVSDGQWEIALTYIAQWNSSFLPGTKQVKKVGPLEWYEGAKISELEFRNRFRQLYGLVPLATVPGAATTEIAYSHPEITSDCGCTP